MPWKISPDKTAGPPFKVINATTKAVKGTHPTWKKATAQLRALYANAPHDEAVETEEHVSAILADLDAMLGEIGEDTMSANVQGVPMPMGQPLRRKWPVASAVGSAVVTVGKFVSKHNLKILAGKSPATASWKKNVQTPVDTAKK